MVAARKGVVEYWPTGGIRWDLDLFGGAESYLQNFHVDSRGAPDYRSVWLSSDVTRRRAARVRNPLIWN
jgi:hypothetical protein